MTLYTIDRSHLIQLARQILQLIGAFQNSIVSTMNELSKDDEMNLLFLFISLQRIAFLIQIRTRFLSKSAVINRIQQLHRIRK